MEWLVEHGPKVEAIAKQMDLETCPFWIDRPILGPENLWVWDCWQELQTDRPVGLSVGGIPWSSIDAYARRHDIHGDDFDELVYLVRSIDNAFLKASKANHGK